MFPTKCCTLTLLSLLFFVCNFAYCPKNKALNDHSNTPPLATRNVSFISQNHTQTIPHCCLSPWFDLCEMQRCAAEKELDRGDRSLEAQVRENGRSVKGTGEFELDNVSTFVPKTNAANSMRIVATNADSKFIAGPPKIIQTENPV